LSSYLIQKIVDRDGGKGLLITNSLKNTGAKGKNVKKKKWLDFENT
jgi:hypothetical protein